MTKKTEIIWHQVGHYDLNHFGESIPGSELPNNDRDVINQDGTRVRYVRGRWKYSNDPEWKGEAFVIARAELPIFPMEMRRK